MDNNKIPHKQKNCNIKEIRWNIYHFQGTPTGSRNKLKDIKILIFFNIQTYKLVENKA
jgi:hypothetical protein